MTFYTYIGHTRKELLDLIGDLSRYYVTYKIKKRSGKIRTLHAPQPKLKEVQRDLLYKVFYEYSSHPLAHGFVKSRSPITNATEHVKRKVVINIDIKDFFPSIVEPRVKKLIDYLLSLQKNFEVETDTAELITHLVCYKGALPQGAPTSPALSNLACLDLDRDLNTYALAEKVRITRYADDITLSANKQIDIKQTSAELIRQLYKHGFRPNYKKLRCCKRNKRMVVTGIVVNDKLNIRKTTWRNFRAKLHNIIRDKVSVSMHEFQQMRGYTEWVNSANPKRANQFLKQLSVIEQSLLCKNNAQPVTTSSSP